MIFNVAVYIYQVYQQIDESNGTGDPKATELTLFSRKWKPDR